jgi:hypothetical protein
MESVHEQFVSINEDSIMKIIFSEEIRMTMHIVVQVYSPPQLKHQGCTELLMQFLESDLVKLVFICVILGTLF